MTGVYERFLILHPEHHAKWSYKSKKGSSHVFNMATPCHSNESAHLSMIYNSKWFGVKLVKWSDFLEPQLKNHLFITFFQLWKISDICNLLSAQTLMRK